VIGRRGGTALAALLAVVALVAACVPPPSEPGSPGRLPTNFQFRADRVTVIEHNDNFVYGSRDEPYLLNVWFRVRLGQHGSARAGVVGDRAAATFSLGTFQSRHLEPHQQAAIDFNDVKLLDVADLFSGNDHLEVVGTWTWAMERDDVGVTGVANNVASILEDALNQTVARGGLPSEPEELVSLITDDLGRAFNLVAGALFGSIPGIPDDAIGSRFYVGLGTRGTLAQIVDSTTDNVAFPTVQIPIVTIPPDIGGGQIFSLHRERQFTDQVFDQGQGRHLYDLRMVDTRFPNVPPIAEFAASTVTGSAPLEVTFDAAASFDPDGTISSYRWDFGDFTTGTGSTATHTFLNGGSYPVTLSITDNRGATTSRTVNITVAGGPMHAPTGLTKVGSGCCTTYGNFTWDPVAGAEAYRIEMVPTLGCIATSALQEFPGQVSGGTVVKVGLCLGTRYDVRI